MSLAEDTSSNPAAETKSEVLSENQKNVPNATSTATTEAPAATTDESQRPGLVVHHLDISRSQRLLWLLEELEIPYSIEKYYRNKEWQAPKELKAVHSLGKAPVLTDGDVTIAESGAIIEYVISKYGEKFRPSESGKIDDIYFSHYAEGSLMPILVTKFVFEMVPQRSPVFIRFLLKGVFKALTERLVEPQLRDNCALIESHLEKSKTGWLAGCDYPTSADFMMMFPAEILAASAFAGPKIKQYIERIHQRPAYKRSIEKGGEFKALTM